MRPLIAAWQKAIRSRRAASVNAVAAKLEPVLRRRFLAAVKTMQGHVDLEALVESLRLRDAAQAMTSLHPETWPETLRPTAALLPRAFTQAGTVAASILASQLRVDVSFNLINPRAVLWARTNSARLITEVTASVQASVREIIGRAFTEGFAPREAARLIREIVGVTERQAGAVMTYQGQLLVAGRSADDAARLAARYGQQLLNQRALTIARTETITSSCQGQQELWRQAVDRGLLNPEATWRQWIVTDDDRLCEAICLPMDGQIVGLEEPFTTGDGRPAMMPGQDVHPNCRCAYGLSFIPPEVHD